MHAVFFIMGIREEVDLFLKWASTRQVLYPFENPDLVPNGPKDANGNLLKKGHLPLDVGIRYGLFGTYEATFPEEAKDQVLTMLRF